MNRTRERTNPWGLTVLEVSVLKAYFTHANHSAAAGAIGKSVRCISNALDRIARKMAVQSRAQVAAKWAEWTAGKYSGTPRTTWVCRACNGMGFVTRRQG